jgi:glycoside hydrolase-like protein
MTAIGSVPDGTRGFDCDQRVTLAMAQAAYAANYRFAIRYVRRNQTHPYDLNVAEIVDLLRGGLGVMVVQHVAPDAWTPSADLGTTYGRTAVTECRDVGLPHGVSVWLDLEGVERGLSRAAVIGYCVAWHAQVEAAGYRPGLYVGFHAGLSAQDLYHALPFDSYWAAYNLNRDLEPAVRGVQMRQSAAQLEDHVAGIESEFDVDVIRADAKGGTPSLLLP